MPRPKGAAITRKLASDNDAIRASEEWVRTRIYGLEDAELRWLRDQYVAAYKEIVSLLPGVYDADGNPLPARRTALLRAVQVEIDALMNTLAQEFDPAFDAAFLQGYYGRAWALDMMTNPEVGVTLRPFIPTEAIRSVLLQDFMGGTEWVSFERAEFLARMKRSLAQSLIQGEGMTKAQVRLLREMGIKPGQTKDFTGSMWRSLLVVRTEIMRASNLGALAIYEQNKDILNGWEWVAARDERVCRICGALDGQTFEFGDYQQPPPSGSHIGCRCTVVPVLINSELSDAITGGPREDYCTWAARTGIVNDANLCRQRGADAHALNKTAAR